MLLGRALRILDAESRRLGSDYQQAAQSHAGDVDVSEMLSRFVAALTEQTAGLGAFLSRYPGKPAEPAAGLVLSTEPGGLALVEDLIELQSSAVGLQGRWTAVSQAAQALGDLELHDVSQRAGRQLSGQQAWFDTRLKSAAAQALAAGGA